jgi:hypothetical protein
VAFAREIAQHSRAGAPVSKVVERYAQDPELARVQLLIRVAEILSIDDAYWICRQNTQAAYSNWHTILASLGDRAEQSISANPGADIVAAAKRLLAAAGPKRRAVDAAIGAGA